MTSYNKKKEVKDIMAASPEERLRAVLVKLASREQEEVLDFAEFLA